jgi:hypothetical protein
MNRSDRLGRFVSMSAGGFAIVLAAILVSTSATPPAQAGCACGITGPHHHFAAGGHHWGPGPGDICNDGLGGSWYWMRSPEQEKLVVMSLFSRYCIRCHGVDGRGVWDIPGVPDFTNLAWQGSRSENYRARVIIEGRGAVMPAFRGTLTLEEAHALGRYLYSFAPGTPVSRPDFTAPASPNANAPAPAPPAAPAPAPAPPPAAATPGPFNR